MYFGYLSPSPSTAISSSTGADENTFRRSRGGILLVLLQPPTAAASAIGCFSSSGAFRISDFITCIGDIFQFDEAASVFDA